MVSSNLTTRAAVGDSAVVRSTAPARRRAGITLTEILIAIMIMGVGLVSLATLFPIGLLRLREASRSTRSAFLLQSAASDAISRGLFSSSSFSYADYLNYVVNSTSPPYWYITPSGRYDPLKQDTAYYSFNGGDWKDPTSGTIIGAGSTFGSGGQYTGPGLPIAYDPLWRYQALSTVNGTQGYYVGDTYEARFGYGLTSIRSDGDSYGTPSAHGLQRITNFNRPAVMASSLFIPNIFVSQEDVLWQDPNAQGSPYTIGGLTGSSAVTVQNPSPVIPDLNSSGGSMTVDWHYSWMYTGQLTNALNTSTFDGSIVVFENRQFGIHQAANPAYTPAGNFAQQNYEVDGEVVVEGVFGYSSNVIGSGGPTSGPPGYGAGASRTVLLRWPTTMVDPVVRPGDWIADVTYERQATVVLGRFLGWPQPNNPNAVGGLQNWTNNGEWDNLPAQRCFWYQVQKATTPDVDPSLGASYRSMVVYTNQNLQARTVLGAGGTPVNVNAALIMPNVVNVIPQTIFVR